MNDETVKGLLRKAGLKVTNQRMMVLDIIASHPAEHLTAEEIYDLAKVNSPEIGLATIYRTVQVLLDLHVIDKVTFDDGFTRYELNVEESASGHRHHHAICTGCGKVYSLESDLLDSLEDIFIGYVANDIGIGIVQFVCKSIAREQCQYCSQKVYIKSFHL